MRSGEQPSFDVVDGALRRIGAGGAPEAHGSLCGLACLLGARAGPAWVAGLVTGVVDDAGEPVAPRNDAGILGDLATATFQSLTEGDLSFSPLLPPDDRPLSLRAAGLAEWCAGFMHGLGEGAGQRAATEALGGETTREIMSDFSEIARVSLGEEESELEAETAYAELVEFVRVSVQLVFEELHAVRESLPATSLH
jgi:uncharacterized protein YgfB (UPF0149 family)